MKVPNAKEIEMIGLIVLAVCIIVLLLSWGFITVESVSSFMSEFNKAFPNVSSAFLAVVSAIFAYVLSHSLYDYIMRPNLRLEKDRIWAIKLDRETYFVTRVKVENTGKSAAENCNGKLIIEQSDGSLYFDICWIYPEERSTVTINSKDCKFLDACAINTSTGQLFAPTERGWEPDRIPLGNKTVKGWLRVTAKNSRSVEKRITIKPSGDGHILEIED